MVWKSIWDFILKYKTYFLLAIIVIIVMINFIPIKNGVMKLLPKQEVKAIQDQSKQLEKQHDKNDDSIAYYKNLYETAKVQADSSKVVTKYIKIKTNEEVNHIPSLPYDTNVALFPSDLEDYLTNR